VLGCEAAVIDANDLGIDILGVSSSSVDVALLKEIMRDNPLGQSPRADTIRDRPPISREAAQKEVLSNLNLT
jgi:hypothetical protein